jgi:hypothetical protein
MTGTDEQRGEEMYEWGTLQPGGNVCEWDTEDQARRAAAISQAFPGGAHPLVRREVSPWIAVQS